jgi:[ribosomal protein S5]-alanine N-acetyltransferase
MSNSDGAPDLRGLAPRGNDLVLLAPWQAADLPVIAEASGDSYIPQVTSVPARYTAAGGAAWLQRQRDQLAAGRGCPMAVWARESAQVVGMATIAGINWPHRRGAVGYWILSRHRGHGYARAAAALLPGIAAEIGLVRIEAMIEPANHASQAVCRSAGFVPEGLLRSYYRIGAENRDMLVFSLLPAADGSPPG